MSLPGEQGPPTAIPVPTGDLLNALPTPTLVLDPDDGVALANQAAESFLNASFAALRERGWSAPFGTDSPVCGLVAESRAKGGSIAAYDLDIGFVGGRVQRSDVLVAPVPHAPGWRILGFQPRAVSAMVERQKDHVGAARSATGVAAMLAHEIKNPLSGIRGAAQLLAQTADAEGQELTNLICAEVDRVRHLIDRMEGFTDERPMAREPENIHAILGHVRRIAEQGFARGLTIRERYDPSLPPVAGNRDALVQVFLNLVKNAAEASPPAGEILLTTAYRHGLRIGVQGSTRRVALPMEVCVIDQGDGAPPEIVDHMFDPFVSSKRGGSGLGLALVAKVVADHGGLVEHERTSDPPRTTMRVLLPMAVDG